MSCRHCQARPGTRPRHLCSVCYYDPTIRELYPSTSKYGRRSADSRGRTFPLPTPTAALPGTPEKIAVLAERARLRQQLWHPSDGLVLESVSERAG